jgi:hypothetical protein
MRQDNEINVIQIGEENVKLSLFADDMILYLKESKNLTKRDLDLIQTFSKVTGCKISRKNQ